MTASARPGARPVASGAAMAAYRPDRGRVVLGPTPTTTPTTTTATGRSQDAIPFAASPQAAYSSVRQPI